MTITAKFATVCPCCNSRINAGDKVEWIKGSKARHVACASRPGAVTATSAAPRRSYRSSGAGSAASVAGYSSYCTGRESCGCYDCAS
jgi:hypothetical protein